MEKTRYVYRLTVVLLCLLCPVAARAASFDCSRATTRIEKMICSDAELSKLDEALGAVYSEALKKAPDAAALKQRQFEWLKEQNRCKDSVCLKKLYKQRVSDLKTFPPDFTAVLPPDITEFDIDCGNAWTSVEKIICQQAGDRFESLIAKMHKEMRNTLQWTLMRSNNRQTVIDSQRQWQQQIRDACKDSLCLAEVYPVRVKELLAMQDRPNQCYLLQPILDVDGNVLQIEPVCQVMEENLNRFCHQPPMVCELKVAPEFCQQITFPKWTPLNPEEHLKLIERVLRTPLQVESRQYEIEEKIWQEEKLKIEEALTKQSITFSEGDLDLFNMHNLQKAYRLDYGTCRSLNSQLDDPNLWNAPVVAAPIRIQLTPEVVNSLFTKYFPLESSPAFEVFLYGGQTFSYYMFGYLNKRNGESENRLNISRREQWINPISDGINLHRRWVCQYKYKYNEVTK